MHKRNYAFCRNYRHLFVVFENIFQCLVNNIFDFYFDIIFVCNYDRKKIVDDHRQKKCRNYRKLSWDWDRRRTSAISTDKTFSVYVQLCNNVIFILQLNLWRLLGWLNSKLELHALHRFFLLASPDRHLIYYRSKS